MQNQLKMARLQSPNAPSLGDIVVIKDDPSRGCWKKGKIVNLFKSGDGQIRSAKVKLSPAKSADKGSLTLAMGKCLWFSVKIKVCQSSLSSP